jgi:putative phosphoesterase
MMQSFKIAVISDTHVPDRTPDMSQQFLADLRNEKVDMILHAGDICIQRVIDVLGQIAPLKAVRGNRDLLLFRNIPLIQQFEVYGVKFALMHGHINFVTYWLDKVSHVFNGYQLNRYITRIEKAAPGADVYVFGHTHHAENFTKDGVCFFNPGSITYGDVLTRTRSWGIIEVSEDQQVNCRIIPFAGE